MKLKKKILLCSILVGLSPILTNRAEATSIVNLDNVPHNVRLEIAGEEREISLMPYGRWESHYYPIKIIYDTYTSAALEPRGQYALWKDGKIALQNDGRRVYRRY